MARRLNVGSSGFPSPPPGTRTKVDLAGLTSLRLGGSARWLLRAQTLPQLREGLAWAQRLGVPTCLLGGGSNTIVPDEGFEGLVLQPALRGIQVQRDGRDVLLRVAAGEPWDAVVAYAVANGWQGIECLSGVPGWAGAAPVQNIGAYGQELGEVVDQVEMVQRRSGRYASLSGEQCGFGYRTSRFKQDPGWVIVALTLRLRPEAPPRLAYPAVREAVGAWGSVADVRREVLRIRREKSMLLAPLCALDDENQHSAGSFFVNPLLEMVEAVRVRARAMRLGHDVHSMPWHRQPDGRVKLSAAWLIERSGVARGYRRGTVGVSSRHCLALVHHGQGSATELFELEHWIRQKVASTFGVTLQREPVVLGMEAGRGRRRRDAA